MSSIMSMSSMVSSSLLMKVELLEPVSMALSSEVCELGRKKKEERLRPRTAQPDHGGISRVAPKGKGALPARPLAFRLGLPSWARFYHQARQLLITHHTAVGHLENQGPQVISTLQLSFSSAKSFIKVANKLRQCLLS